MNTLFKSQLLAATASLLLAGAATASQIQTAGTSTLLAQTTAPKCARLSLSTAQLEKLSALKDKFILDTAQDKAQLKVERHQLFSLLSEPTVNKDEVLALETKMNTLKNKISDARINLLLAKSDVLTPEQREKIHDRFLMRSLKGGHQGRKFAGAKGKGCGFGKQSITKGTVSG
jgi:Spy/CpxP family protein refolding chaperone